jgi:membrane protease subunit (stomatin/prohibitin family)
VCPEACWNGKANLCGECAPDFEEEVVANRAQVMAEVARQQMYEKAEQQAYAKDIDMSTGGSYAAGGVAEPFCPECGAAAARTAKFCPDCGGKLAGAK